MFPGQSVGRGTVIGGMGCSGVCYGPHTQFDVRVCARLEEGTWSDTGFAGQALAVVVSPSDPRHVAVVDTDTFFYRGSSATGTVMQHSPAAILERRVRCRPAGPIPAPAGSLRSLTRH